MIGYEPELNKIYVTTFIWLVPATRKAPKNTFKSYDVKNRFKCSEGKLCTKRSLWDSLNGGDKAANERDWSFHK